MNQIRAVTRSSTKKARKPANWLQKYTTSNSEMKELQRKDNDFGPLVTWKESKEPTTREQMDRSLSIALPIFHIVAEKLVNEFVSRFGIPLEIHTDQGNLFQELCRLFDIHKTKSTPFHPSFNGLIEKFNQTLGKMIKSYVDENKRKWDFYIPILMSAYGSTVHPSTGFGPNKLMLGREVNLPHDLNRLDNHVKKYRLHAKLAADVPDSQDNTFLKKNTVPYNVTWGNQCTEDLAINIPGSSLMYKKKLQKNTETQIRTTDADTQTDKMEDFEK
ncbi:Hypothetical predicted protein [Mytilus galloprovincialis]|uniref:Integrase catalytic domain-containing protein n=1 Tax=Mytilus galloprovincialis TaxID=29158 RepID=A0A8B6EHG2_MYTGA|nr:Hypothetical predicted protein [Mytilus galloprovincialis]